MGNLWVVIEKTFCDRMLEDVAVVGVCGDGVDVLSLMLERATIHAARISGASVTQEGSVTSVVSSSDGAPLIVLVAVDRVLNQTQG